MDRGRQWVEVSIFLTFNSVIEICYFIPVHNLFNVLYKGTQTVTDVFSLFYSEVVNKKTIFIIQLPLPFAEGAEVCCGAPATVGVSVGTLPHCGLGQGSCRVRKLGAPSKAQEQVQAELAFTPILSNFGFMFKYVLF